MMYFCTVFIWFFGVIIAAEPRRFGGFFYYRKKYLKIFAKKTCIYKKGLYLCRIVHIKNHEA